MAVVEDVKGTDAHTHAYAQNLHFPSGCGDDRVRVETAQAHPCVHTTLLGHDTAAVPSLTRACLHNHFKSNWLEVSLVSRHNLQKYSGKKKIK